MFERPTLTEIITRIKNDIVSRITGASTLLRRSILSVFATAFGGAIHSLYGNIEYNKDQLFILDADLESLKKHANEYGLSLNEAEKATGEVTATGTAGTSIPIYSELQSATGQVYLTDTAAILDAGGLATIDITAKVAGENGNDDAGISLSFVSPISGVNTTVTVGATGLSGGADEEEEDDFRNRILTRKRKPPHGGIQEDYVNWMLEVSGVTRAWSIPMYQGVGTIGCAFVRDNDDSIFPDDSEKETVYDYIVSHTEEVTGKIVGAPVTAVENIYMISLSPLAVNFNIQISPNTGDVQTAVTSQLEDLINVDGGPEQTIRLSRARAAISAAAGEEYHEITYPTEDITASSQQIHVLGTITFSDYEG
jgi:uncharacterized phage protein gp47/JayE